MRKSERIEAIESDIIIQQKAILLGIVLNFQKTSVSLGNFCTGD